MKALAIAETAVRRMFRDRANYFFVFILPLGIIVIIGSLFGSGFQPSIGLVAPPDGLGADLAARIEVSEDFEIVRFDQVEDLMRSVERSSIQAGVEIPEDLGTLLAGDQPAVVVFVARPDSVGPQLQAAIAAQVTEFASEVTAARLLDGDLQADLTVVRELGASLPDIGVDVERVGTAEPATSLGRFDLGASSQLVLFMFLTGLTGSAAMIQSRQLGVSRRMLGTPTSPGTIVLGEALGRYGVVLVQGLYIVVVTLVAFGVNWGDPLGAAAIIALFGLVAAGGAMLMGTLFRNDEQAGGIGVMLGLGLAALGGAMVPIEVMPPGMQQVAKLTPHAWALDGFAELVRRGGTVADILPQLGVLAGFASGMLVIAAWRFRMVLTRRL